jgi:hypothetical protein
LEVNQHPTQANKKNSFRLQKEGQEQQPLFNTQRYGYFHPTDYKKRLYL